eukprot:2833794-Amphidinium_carterae.1
MCSCKCEFGAGKARLREPMRTYSMNSCFLAWKLSTAPEACQLHNRLVLAEMGVAWYLWTPLPGTRSAEYRRTKD